MNPNPVFSTLLEQLQADYYADRCLIVIQNRESGEIVVRARSPKMPAKDVQFSRAICAEAIANRYVIREENASAPASKYSGNESLSGLHFVSILAAPMLLPTGEVVGALYLDRRQMQKGQFTLDDQKFLARMAKVLTPILQQHEELLRQMEVGLIGQSPAMRELKVTIAKIAPTEASVLIRGESGTGKELIAREIHHQSRRATRSYVTINMGALSETLLESELFGHVKGAFTGAHKDKKGLFKEADGGTIFLDEIGDAALATQVKLLRVLQEGEFTPVGGTKTEEVDVRVIAATNADLAEKIKAKTFREDLFFRLNVISLTTPALRDRREDIPLLATHFLQKLNARHNKTVDSFASDALDLMQNQAWPGNVRQLQHLIEQVVVLHEGCGSITAAELFPDQKLRLSAEQLRGLSGKNLNNILQETERHFVNEALQRHNWNKTKAAAELKISRMQLDRLIKRYELTPPVE